MKKKRFAQALAALESQLARGKFVTIEVNPNNQPLAASQMRYAGIFADEPTFDDWMKKLAFIRKEANAFDNE